MTEAPKTLYDRMVLKSKLEVLKKAQAVSELETDLNRTDRLREQLAEIIQQTAVQNGTTTPLALQSASHYGGRVYEQMTAAENRVAFLKTEMDTRQKQMTDAMLHHRKMQEKQREVEAALRQTKADKADAAIAARRPSKS